MAFALNTAGRGKRQLVYLPAQPLRGVPSGVASPVASWAWSQLDTPSIAPWNGISATGLGDANVSVDDIASAYGSFANAQDVRVALAKAQAKLQTLYQQRDQASSQVWGGLSASLYFDPQIAKTQAEVAALQAKLAVQSQSETSSGQLMMIAQVLGVVGVGLGVALTVAVVARAARGR